MQIENKRIGKNYPVYIIAEAGVNHNNDLSLAFKMVDIAKESGADAIKFQTFKANNIQLQNSVKPRYQKNIQKNYYNLIKSLETSFKDQKKIFNYCNKKKIEIENGVFNRYLDKRNKRVEEEFIKKSGVPILGYGDSKYEELYSN